MDQKSTYEGFEQLVQTLKREAFECNRSEEPCREQEFFRSLLEIVQVVILILDTKGSIIYFNPCMEEISGYRLEDVKGLDWFSTFLPEQDRDRIRELFKKATSNIQKKGNINPIVTKDGRKRFIEWFDKTLKYSTGDVIGLIAIGQDITESKQAKEALEKSELYLRTIFEFTPAGIILIKADTHEVVDINDFAVSIINSTKEKIIGHVCHKHICPAEEGQCPITDLKQTVDQSERILLNVNGEPIPIFKTVVTINLDGHEYLLESFIDITDMKQTELALKESEARYRSVFENVGAATVIIDEDMILSMVNKEAEKLSGYSKEEVEGNMRWTEFVAEEDLRKMKEYHLKRRESGDPPPTKYEFRLVDKDGNIKNITMNIGMIPGTKKSVASLLDVTPHKRAEEQISKSLREKEVLLQEIHHRVKNNMQIISSLLNLQSEYIKDEESLKMFRESRDRIFSMASIHEMLYRSEDIGKIDFDFYIKSLGRHIILTYRTDPNDVTLNVNCSDVSLGLNKAVPCGLIINELISNALKHAFPEGRKGKINIDFHSDRDNRMKLVVGDDGIGLPENINISDSRTLGFRLVSILVSQLKGTIQVERRNGSVFSITFVP